MKYEINSLINKIGYALDQYTEDKIWYARFNELKTSLKIKQDELEKEEKLEKLEKEHEDPLSAGGRKHSKRSKYNKKGVNHFK